MLSSRYCGRVVFLRSVLFCVSAVLLMNNSTLAAASDSDRLAELGRRIYVDGILPDGSRLKAIRFEGASEVTGAEAACVNCHRRSGYGAIEGRILVPPIAGAVLFVPGVFAATG